MNLNVNSFVEFGNHLQDLQKIANVLATHLHAYKYNAMFPNNPSLKLVMMTAQRDILNLKSLCISLKEACDDIANGKQVENMNDLFDKVKEYCGPLR